MRILLILLLLLPTIANATPPTRANNYVANTIIDPTAVNTNENALYSYLQVGVDTYAAGSITGTAVSGAAAIPYGSLSLSGSIVNADISPTAAIVGSKLDLTSPGAIGSTAPNTGKFTNLTITGTLNSGVTNQGDVFYDNGASIVRLTPGTAGQVLKTGGAAANPSWSYPSGELGTWASKTVDTAYQATTDGFFVGYIYCDNTGQLTINTDSSNPPTTTRMIAGCNSSTTGGYFSFMTPVKKNDYYKANSSGTHVFATSMYFLPLGS